MLRFPLHLPILTLFALSFSAIAGIDSGGGLSSGGGIYSHSSIGGAFQTITPSQAIPLPGDPPTTLASNLSGFIQVIYRWGPSSVTDFDSAADADHDGSSNFMEFLAGTDPNSAASVFRPQGTYAGGIFRMPVPTLAGRDYQIWGSRDLNHWTLYRTLAGNGSVRLFEFDEKTITSGPLYRSKHPSTCFFRISITLPDNEPDLDSDQDGNSNLLEYLAGTDPYNAASLFNPQGSYADGVFRMPIPTLSDRIYRVWASRDLQNWTLHQTLSGNGALQVFEFDETRITSGPLYRSTHPASCFFRIQILIP